MITGWVAFSRPVAQNLGATGDRQIGVLVGGTWILRVGHTCNRFSRKRCEDAASFMDTKRGVSFHSKRPREEPQSRRTRSLCRAVLTIEDISFAITIGVIGISAPQ